MQFTVDVLMMVAMDLLVLCGSSVINCIVVCRFVGNIWKEKGVYGGEEDLKKNGPIV